METLRIGPLFTSCSSPQLADARITPLGLQMEWATARKGTAIPLFRRISQHAPNRLRLEHIVFASDRLPFDLECSEHYVVETRLGVYLPAEALLAELYSRFQVTRSVFGVLSELAGLVALSGSVRCPIATPGLLIPQAERKGFVLNSVTGQGDRVFAEIGWRPSVQRYVFHTCVCEFVCSPVGHYDAGIWRAPTLIGVHGPLLLELRHLVCGNPDTMFTPSGRSLIAAQSSTAVAVTVPD